MIIVFLLMLFIIVITLSTINICVQNVDISKENLQKINYDYLVFIKLKFLNKIDILKIKINPERINKINSKFKIKEKMEQANLKKLKKDLPNKNEFKDMYKKLNVKLEEIHLNLELGTYNCIITSALITILSSVFGIVLSKFIYNYDSKKHQYKMMPIYQNKNIIKLSFNCIIQVKVVHIISIIFKLIKNRKESKKNESASNRRSYDYSYEQY
jgi:hypothetical protein